MEIKTNSNLKFEKKIVTKKIEKKFVKQNSGILVFWNSGTGFLKILCYGLSHFASVYIKQI